MEVEVSTKRSVQAKSDATHPVRPRPAKFDIAKAEEAIAARYPKVLAALAK